jgi:hypothetical protein
MALALFFYLLLPYFSNFAMYHLQQTFKQMYIKVDTQTTKREIFLSSTVLPGKFRDSTSTCGGLNSVVGIANR